MPLASQEKWRVLYQRALPVCAANRVLAAFVSRQASTVKAMARRRVAVSALAMQGHAAAGHEYVKALGGELLGRDRLPQEAWSFVHRLVAQIERAPVHADE